MIPLMILVISFTEAFASHRAPKVVTDQGVLRGKYDQTWKGREINAFTGIPFAKPPVGDLRFKAPVPAENWNHILDASKPHPICTQIDIFQSQDAATGQEDCLYLNVYTPQLPDSTKELLPVIFNIHGGGLISGHANLYGPRILLEKDVVLVTANYRLGSLGFITTGDEIVPGNNGLKDQNLALKWTKQHIANFGGDPNLITLFGESAGAVCVHYHMLSPLSKPLINGAIFHSNSALGLLSYAPVGQGLRNTKKLAQFLNCSSDTSQDMIECLRKIDARDIVQQDLKFVEWSYDPLIPFKPVVEPLSEEAFLSEDPIEIIKSGKAADVPILTGLTTDDGAIKSAYLFDNPKLIEELDKDFEKVAPLAMQYYETALNKNFVSQKIKEFYFGDRKIDASLKTEVTNMFTDSWFLLAQDTAVRLHFQYSKSPVYYFLFGYRGSVTFANVFGDNSHNYGVCHADDLLYLFNFDDIFSDYKPNESDKMMTDVMSTIWANFAKTGNPTPKDDSSISVSWNPIKTSKLEYYFIKNATDMRMQEGLYEERSQFWRNLPIDPRRTKI